MYDTLGSSLSERAISGFPLSIGTGMAMETLFTKTQPAYDPNRVAPEHVDPGKYNTCFINLRTLYRNLVNSLPKGVFEQTSPDSLISVLIEEIGIITEMFQVEGGGCGVKFYNAKHKLLKQRAKNNTHVLLTLREPSTNNQKFYSSVEEKILDALNKYTDSIITYSDGFEAKSYENALVMTNQPYDLLAEKDFKMLHLLESNTGVVKDRYLWGSKYYPFSGQDMSFLPFKKRLLFVFGDRAEIKPGPMALRKAVYETAVSRKWTPVTTDDKITLDLGLDIRDLAMGAVLNSYK